jgi:carbon monoxide dehydrogenase subunit G
MPRPPEDLFDLLADVRNEVRWHPDVREVRKLGDGPVGAGTAFDARYRGFGDMRVEVTEYERPRHLRFSAEGSKVAMDVSFDFAPSGEGTDVSARMDADLRGPARLLAPVFGRMLRREVRKRPDQMMSAFDEPRPRPAAAASGRRTPPG